MTASISYDAEFMTNYVPAVPVAAGSHFAAVLDPVSRRPVVIGLTNDESPKLQAIGESTNGTRNIIDLGDLLNIPQPCTIQAFDIQQAPDLSLFLVVATKASDTTSNILVVKRFNLGPNLSLTTFPIQVLPQVLSVHVAQPSSGASDDNYPMVALIHQAAGRPINSSDISRISVHGGAWTTMRDLSLPNNAEEIHSIVPASCVYGKGVFVLYTIDGQKAITGEFAQPLRHSTDGTLAYTSVGLKCPVGASAIASYIDDQGHNSALIVACDAGLQHFTTQDITDTNTAGTLIYSAPELHGIDHMYLTQDADCLSLWANNGAQQLVYLSSTASTLAQGQDKSIILMPAGTSGDFAATISSPDDKIGQGEVCQTLISKTNAGQFTMLQQSKITGLWKEEPFYVYNPHQNFEIPSHTITVKVADDNGKPCCHGMVQIKASSTTSLIANGRNINIGSAPTWIGLDDEGALHLITATNGLAGRSFTISGLRDSQGKDISTTGQVIDPAKKSMAALSKIQNKDDLKRDSAKLWSSGQMPDDTTLDNAARCFQSITKAYTALPSDGSVVGSGALRSAPQLAAISVLSVADDVGEVLMDGWNWIKEKAHEVEDWIVEEAGAIWTFACKLGGEVKKFVLDCVEKIAQAATWIWDKIKIGVNKMIEYLGFLFSWDDIKATKNTLSSLLTAGLDFGVIKIDGMEKSVDTFFTGLQQKVKNLKALPTDMKSEKVNSASGPEATAHNSTSFNWTSERLKNGGVQNTQIQSNKPVTDKGQACWRDILEPIGTALLDTAKQLGQDITALFDKNQSLSTGDLLKNLGVDLLDNILNTVKKTVIALLEALKWIIQELSKIGNYVINIPVISPLYKKIAGHDLTLFDAIALVIAIPATVLIKAITNAAPPTLSGIPINGQLFSDLTAKPSPLSAQTKFDLAVLTSGTVVSIVMLKSMYNLARAAIEGITGGAEGAVEFMSPGKAMRIIGIAMDALAMTMTLPDDPDLPGYDLRLAASCVGFFRIGCNLVYTFAPLPPDRAKQAKDAVMVVNVLSAFVSYGLVTTVYLDEVNTATWSEKDDDVSVTSSVSSGFNCLAGFGAAVLAYFSVEEPEIAAVGAGVMVIASAGKAVTDGAKLGLTYRKKHNARVTPNSD